MADSEPFLQTVNHWLSNNCFLLQNALTEKSNIWNGSINSPRILGFKSSCHGWCTHFQFLSHGVCSRERRRTSQHALCSYSFLFYWSCSLWCDASNGTPCNVVSDAFRLQDVRALTGMLNNGHTHARPVKDLKCSGTTGHLLASFQFQTLDSNTFK